MGRRRKSAFGLSAARNNRTFIQYIDRLTELAMSSFEWRNVPETIDIRFLEKTLLMHGQAVFFYDPALEYLCLPVTLEGALDVYENPTGRRAYASNGYNARLTQSDSVIIYNNMLRRPSYADLEDFALRLYNLDRIIDVNANAQKTPVLISATEQQRLTMLNLYQQYDGNQPYIFGDKNLYADGGISCIKTDAPYVADKIYELKTRYWNEALTYLGISNVAMQKKERMISDEVQRSQGGTIASRFSRTQARQSAVDTINEMFDLDIEVEFREDFNMETTMLWERFGDTDE